MRTILTSTGRVLAADWPVLAAWFLGGRIVHYVLIEAAGFVGGHVSIGGILLLPLAILARLVSLVAMFLVVRDGLRSLQAIAPVPESRAERRRTFVTTLLAGILPFFAVYAAWGLLRDDVLAYTNRALEVNAGVVLQAAVAEVDAPTAAVGTEIGLDAFSVIAVVVAFAGRWAWKKWNAKLPAALSAVAVYLEAVWVCLSLLFVADLISGVEGWFSTRVGLQWLIEARDWLGAQLAPVAAVWDGIGWLIGQVVGLTAEPLAWLAIAGVIYGQAIKAEKPTLRIAALERVRRATDRVPGMLRRMLGRLAKEFTSRFVPIIDAVVLMWRAGPVLIGAYVLMYTVVLWGSEALGIAVTRLIGPHPIAEFWGVFDTLLVVAVALVIEPIRIAVVAGAYDSSLGTLRAAVPARLSGQGSTENLTNSGIASSGSTSTQNGPSTSSGTMNGTTSS